MRLVSQPAVRPAKTLLAYEKAVRVSSISPIFATLTGTRFALCTGSEFRDLIQSFTVARVAASHVSRANHLPVEAQLSRVLLRGLNMCGDCQRRPFLDVLSSSQARRRLGLWEEIRFVVARDRQSRNSSAHSALRCSCAPAAGAVQGRARRPDRPLRRHPPSRPWTLLDSSIRRPSGSRRAM